MDCFTISTSPIKSAIEELIQRLNDSMVYHLKRVISEDIRSIDAFLSTGMSDLATRPQTHEEIGAAYKRHAELAKEMRSKAPLLESAEEKNKLLRTVAGGGHEQLFQLQLKMDSFAGAMEEQEQKLRDQTEVLKKNLKSRIESFEEDVEKIAARWKHLKPKDSDLEDEKRCVEALGLVKEREHEVAEFVKQAEKLREECRNFQLDEPDFKLLNEVNADIDKIKTVWGIYEEFQNGIKEFAVQDWISFQSKTHRFDEFLQTWQDTLKKEIAKSGKPSTMQVKIQSDIDSYRVIKSCTVFMRDFNIVLV